MAKVMSAEEASLQAEKKKIQEEKKKLKSQNKNNKKEAKRRAKEIAKQEEALDADEGNGFVSFIATLFIVVLWIAVVCVIVKLDIGGFGSSVLTPVLKDVPVVNKILPGVSLTETNDPGSYGGYSNLQDAVNKIKELEVEVEQMRTTLNAKEADIAKLVAENQRLSEFEERQVEFQRIRTEFYEEVIYAENGPGAEEYRKYFEEMNPEMAEYLYKQVVIQEQESKEVQDYARAYSEMKPKEAAAIFDTMTDNFDLVAKILQSMTAKNRGDILAKMDAANAARLTKIMNPDS